MSGLSLDQISDYNNRNAFTRVRSPSARTAATFMESVSSSNNKSVKTKTLSDSYTLLSGLADRMEMIRANLGTMLGYAELGSSAKTATERDEYIGYLRSLSGGIDDIVDQTQWNDQRTLDGRSIDLSLNGHGSGNSRKIELNSFYTSDELGFNLTKQPSTGKADIFYDYYSSYRNHEAGVVGLDISEAVASEVATTKNELETGTYRLEISYAGPDSSISIKTLEGLLINKVEGVDLSGTGQELIDLEVGATLSISKEQILQSVDKYDYENEGPATLYALMDYQRVFRHELSNEDFSQFTERDLDVSYKKRLSDGSGGSMEIETLSMSGIKSGVIGFESGNYSLTINYNGENSSVEIRDSDGKLKYLNYRVDLSGSEKVEIDTGKGISFTIDNDNYSAQSGRMMALFSYEAEGNNNADFDFKAYTRKIQDAIEKLDVDLDSILTAQDEILNINSFQNNSYYSQSASTSTGALITAMLSGSISGSTSTVFGASSANSQLSAAAGEIFSATFDAMNVQSKVRAVNAAKTAR